MSNRLRMCSASATLYTVSLCVICILSILAASIHAIPLDNYAPVVSSSSHRSRRTHHKELSGIYDGDMDTDTRHHVAAGTTRVQRNFYWWQVERKSGVKEIDTTLERQKRFPRIPIGDQCKTHRQCSNSRCCAMKLGMPVCRKRPITGQPCQLSSQKDIRPDTSKLFTYCPCADGLRCKRSRSRTHVCYN